MFGCDKIGRPIFINRIGLVDVPNLFKAITEERFWALIIYIHEHLLKHKLLACSELFDRQIHQLFNLMDLTGFGLSKWTKRNMVLVKKFLGLV